MSRFIQMGRFNFRWLKDGKSRQCQQIIPQIRLLDGDDTQTHKVWPKIKCNLRWFFLCVFASLTCPLQSGSQENLTVDSPRLSSSSEHGVKQSTAPKGRGILRSSSGRAAPVSSDRPPRSTTQPGRPTLRKAESTRVRGSVPVRSSLSTQTKAASVSERLDMASTTLPRASSVISTAEGTTRRTSIHDMLSKDNRQPVSVDTSPPATSTKAGLRSQPTPSEYHPHSSAAQLPKSLSLPCHSIEDPELSTLESLLGPSFTVESVFMDSIFSESAAKNLPFLSLNPTLVSNISGPPKAHPSPMSNHTISQSPTPRSQSNSGGFDEEPCENNTEQALSPEDNQSLWYEYGCVWDQTENTLCMFSIICHFVVFSVWPGAITGHFPLFSSVLFFVLGIMCVQLLCFPSLKWFTDEHDVRGKLWFYVCFFGGVTYICHNIVFVLFLKRDWDQSKML